MDNLNELGIKFGAGTTWIQKHRCGWCNCKIYQTTQQYLINGNICNKCKSMINDKYLKHVNEERIKKMKEKEELLETLAESLKKPMEEEDRQRIETLLKKIHDEIRHTKIDLDYGM